MPERATDSTPCWYVVARLQRLHRAVPFIVSGPYSLHAEAVLQCQRQVEQCQDSLEFTVVDIRFPSDDELFERLAVSAAKGLLLEEP